MGGLEGFTGTMLWSALGIVSVVRFFFFFFAVFPFFLLFVPLVDGVTSLAGDAIFFAVYSGNPT